MTVAQQDTGFSGVAIRGTAWRYLAYFSSKLMVFLSTVILARLLSKDDFGVVGFAITALVFIEVLSGGVGPALVYYAEDKNRSNSAFWLGLIIGIFLFGLTWILAPFIATFFRDERALLVVRALGLTFPFNALGDTHQALLQKKLAFNRIYVPDFLMAMTKGLISIILAFYGFGAWSLIWGQVGGALISSLSSWFVYPWLPAISFELQHVRSTLSYGVRYIGANMISMALLNLDYLLVGRYLGAEALGVYTMAYRLPDLLIVQFASILSTVLFPIYTRMREIPGSLARGFTFTTRYVSLITVPLGLGLTLIARPLILVILTDKWVDVVPILQVLSIYALVRSLAYNAGSAYKAEGRPQIIMYLELIRLVVFFPAVWWAVLYAKSIVMVGWVHMLVGMCACILDLYAAARLLKLPMKDLGVALRPAFVAGLLMSIFVLSGLYVTASMDDLWKLIIVVPVGATTYFAALWIFQRDVLMDSVDVLRGALKLNRGVK